MGRTCWLGHIITGGSMQNDTKVSPKVKKESWWWWSRLTLYLCVGIVAGLCYINSLYGDFVHDDIVAVTTNPDVLGKTSLVQVFLADFWGKPMSDPSSHKSYRPLTVLTFRWNMLIGGECLFS
ncbi:transmembrane and TPR repeat-containing protein CG4050-like [Limulus polyphemus]|uniref:Transmembrane and TPR repeat-containing protein CG4050-like n=1 Tax=Limulus polyphemus TaxID=6850 RepID=A0ABM1RW36_LIMPO|nr:transmembrane and TPR repeat-containing protein CG4050-like [Limulus polyphemus]